MLEKPRYGKITGYPEVDFEPPEVLPAQTVDAAIAQEHPPSVNSGHNLAERERQREDVHESLERRRLEWRAALHGHQTGAIPAAMRLQALRQLERMRVAEQSIAATSLSAALSPALSNRIWTSIGPVGSTNPWWGKDSGRILALAVDPTNANVVYAGSDARTLWDGPHSFEGDRRP